MMKRTVEPEWLDELPVSDPGAVRSRLDLRRVNFFMGNVGIMADGFRRVFPGEFPERIVELGAGDGTFALRLATRLAAGAGNRELILVDRQKLVSPEIQESFLQTGWRAKVVPADVFDFLSNTEEADCIFANLFLHHFDRDKLSLLLRLVAGKTRAFIACEPHRSQVGILGTRLLGLIGCNAVTRHDATISVRAGFRGRELSALLPNPGKWKIDERRSGLFSHTFVAVRL